MLSIIEIFILEHIEINLLLFFKEVNEFIEQFIELRNEILMKFYKNYYGNIEDNLMIK